MATVDLRRSFLETCGELRLRLELVEERRESWFWIPALMDAAAARETEEERSRGGEVSDSGFSLGSRGWRGEAFGEREGGRELRSGAILTKGALNNGGLNAFLGSYSCISCYSLLPRLKLFWVLVHVGTYLVGRYEMN